MTGVILYPSKNHDTLNRRPQDVDRRFRRCMVSPHYQSVSLHPDAEVVCDSGAIDKRDMLNRLTPEAAFKRQRFFESKRRPIDGRPWRLVHYDCLRGVDEELVEANGLVSRIKKRGSEETARPAVLETIRSAEYYASRADDVEGGIAYSAQGATIEQYVHCARALLELCRPGIDWLALGGFCIIGRDRRLVPQFLRTLDWLAPMVRRRGVLQVHVLGVAFPAALAPALAICQRENLVLSTDSAGFELQAANGKVWDAQNIGDCSAGRRGGPYRHAYPREKKWNSISPTPEGFYNPGELLVVNLTRFVSWAESLDLEGVAGIEALAAAQHADLEVVDVFLSGGGHVALETRRGDHLEDVLDAHGLTAVEVQSTLGVHARLTPLGFFHFLSWEQLELGCRFPWDAAA